MNRDHRQTIRRLFSLSTMVAARAEAVSVLGQSQNYKSDKYETHARQLQEFARALGALATTVICIVDLDRSEH